MGKVREGRGIDHCRNASSRATSADEKGLFCLLPAENTTRRTIINKSLTRIARKKSPDDAAAQKDYIDRVFANISTTTSAQEAAASPDLIVEAIVENLKTKQDLFQRFDGIAPAHTIFASNTSSLSVRKIAQLVSDERKKRFLALHYFNPVPAMRLVRTFSSFLPPTLIVSGGPGMPS